MKKMVSSNPSNIPVKRETMTSSTSVSKRKPVTLEDIRLKAYQIYLSRGSNPGNEIQDWLQAKKELGVKDNF